MEKWHFNVARTSKKRSSILSAEVFKTIFLSAKPSNEARKGNYQVDYNKEDDSLIFSRKGSVDSKEYKLFPDGSVNSWSSIQQEQVIELERGGIDEIFINFIKYIHFYDKHIPKESSLYL